ncbi:hypothetical protein ACIQUM_07820 [Amycolatopsis azurea]|uniref:hypothetical protein n=1 Tax=Amycolatopsis azurea TaxID=36819 RepID=UPI0038066A62
MDYPAPIRNISAFMTEDEDLWTDVFRVGQNVAWLCAEQWSHDLAQEPHEAHIEGAYTRALFSVPNGHRRRSDDDPAVLKIEDLRAAYLRERMTPLLERHRRGGHDAATCRWCGGVPGEPAIAVCRYEPDSVMTGESLIEVLRSEGDEVVVRQYGRVRRASVRSFIDYREVEAP